MHHIVQHGLLGTVVEVVVGTNLDADVDEGIDDDRERDEAVAAAAIATIEHLESVFSAYDPGSDLQRWKQDAAGSHDPALHRALAVALDWQRRSAGAFNPMTGALTDRWRLAEQRGEVPSPGELAELAAAVAVPHYTLDDRGRARPIGDVRALNLNAFVKGWIVDRAVEAAVAADPTVEVLVSAGGDLRHHGHRHVVIGIENPLRPYDNEPPVTIVHLVGSALATSGTARRGFRVDGRWYGHVLDPRTGRPVDAIASISVVAADAATADVVATIAGVEPPAEAVRRATEFGTACLVIDARGDRRANEGWLALERTPASGAP